jgi:hypothetical protein
MIDVCPAQRRHRRSTMLPIGVIFILFTIFFSLMLWATRNGGRNYNDDGGDL